MIKIKYLCEYPNHLPKMVELWYNTIGKKINSDMTLSDADIKFRDHLNKDALPLAYIALDGENVVGSCSLRSNDGFKTKYIPWLGSLCVAETHRKRGIGKLLIKMVKEKAQQMGFKKLYLGTFESKISDWYINNGWGVIETITHHDKSVTIMEIEL